MAAKKKATRALREVVSAANAEALLDLVDQLGLVDMVIGRIKAKIEETDIDDFLDDVGGYLKRNPDVLVVGLAAITVATGVVVYLNQRREWNGTERRGVEKPRKSRKVA
jgi:hypothetical protein